MTQSNWRDVVYLSEDEQILLHRSAVDLCRQEIDIARNQSIAGRRSNSSTSSSLSSSSSSSSEIRCPPVWDGIMCWPESNPGQTIYQTCPNYINKFKMTEFAARDCLPNGQWFIHPLMNKTWTNYSACISQEPSKSLIEIHLDYIRMLYHVGYSASILSLVVALIVMLSIRKLRCPRNYLHVNLFASFVLRASVALMRDNLMAKGIGLTQDLLHDKYGNPFFNSEGLHIECRLLYTVFYMSVVANYSWIFVEGLYLHTLVFVTFSSGMKGIWRYITFGWVCPLIVVVPWIVVKATLENEFCWNTQRNPGYLWIIKAPIAASIIVNFFFFLDIIRILYTKLTLNRISGGGKEVIKRRLAKSILVLIPLFGVPYVVFLLLQEDKLSETVIVIKLYSEMAFNSFNGLMIAIIFCFANYEVQTEMIRRCRRLRRERLSSSTASRRTLRGNHPDLNDHGAPTPPLLLTAHPVLLHGRRQPIPPPPQGRRDAPAKRRSENMRHNRTCSTSRTCVEEEELHHYISLEEFRPTRSEEMGLLVAVDNRDNGESGLSRA